MKGYCRFPSVLAFSVLLAAGSTLFAQNPVPNSNTNGTPNPPPPGFPAGTPQGSLQRPPDSSVPTGYAPAPVGSGAGGASEGMGPVRISGGVMAGMVINKVDPVYPPDAKAAGVQGAVVLVAHIGADGAVQSLQAVSGPEVLRRPAIDAVRQWTYRPYLLNGQPTEVQTTVTVNFRLESGQNGPQ